MNKNTLDSHLENPNGPRALMEKVYYKKDVDKLLERALILDSWDDAFEIQQAIFKQIKIVCGWIQSHKYFDDKESYKKGVEKIKRLVFFWKCLKQIRLNIMGG